MEIPFSNYKGGLKQMDTGFKYPLMKDLFETAFSKFNDLHNLYNELKEQGINTIVSAAGTEFNFGSRNRRFAGGSDLPAGCYFTVCSADDFNDFGALRDEMYAYYSGSSGIVPSLFDPKVDTWLADYLLSNKLFTEEEANYPYYFCTYNMGIENEQNKKIAEKYREEMQEGTTAITYGIKQNHIDIDKIIDLRLPETQDWFFKTFVALEMENTERVAKKSRLRFWKEELNSFEELLPSIMSLETGGGDIFGQAVAAWLRDHGANGLIFPSARSTCENVVNAGTITGFKGWIFVLYKDAPPPQEKNLFGNKSTWKDPDHDHIKVKHIATGPEKGSISIRGAKEWNLANFDFEKQIAEGKLQSSPIAEITGARNAEISQIVNHVLAEEAKNNTLWFNDVDTTSFLSWCEKIRG